VLVDARPDNYLMDLAQVESAITERTKAIIAVHLFGMPMDLTALRELALRRGVALVEDCAQATGASIRGQQVGSWGDLGCFSFHPSKTLAGAGDGGAVTTSSSALAARLRSQRYFGQRVSKVHSHLGYNTKLDTLQAIVLFHKLQFLDQWNARRRENARRYMEALRGLPVFFQADGQDDEHVYHLFQLRVADGRRDPLLAHLVARGIDAVVRYPVPIHLQPAFEYLRLGRGSFPVAEHLATVNLCLPLRADMTAEETSLVTDAVAAFHAG
jgi:dTDP-4-amino-4,6-dideoxygalactose transaminase